MAIAEELPIDTGATAEEMAEEIFGDGVTILSATYFGDNRSSGIYSSGDTISPGVMPGDTGVILSTGRVSNFTNSDGSTNTNQSTATSSNMSRGVDGDQDFNDLAGGNSTFDASYLEIEFEAVGDKITIDFVMSSEEYPEFVNSQYNDVVGVWVNGVEATVSIGDGSASISNINDSQTSNIYNDNTNDAFNTEMDGFTITLTFVADVQPGTNTLKIGVADVGDSGYDTNLLIAGGSVQSTIVAEDDSVSFGINESATLDVLANDSSTGGALTITHINGVPVQPTDSVILPSGQEITLNSDGTFFVQGDGDGETIYFNYTIEDLAGNTDTALVGVTQVPCFTKGTLIETLEGPVAIENLRPGMHVPTLDGGAKAIRWIGSRCVKATGNFRPIRITKGTFGATQDLLLSPQHRVLISHHWAELLFGDHEVLVKAKDLINGSTVRLDTELQEVTYFHLLFDQHQIITANGVASESYLPGSGTLNGFDDDTQAEIFALFPQLAKDTKEYGPAARLLLKGYEAAPLLTRLAA